ncbi:MobA/MobL family protein [Teichococcus vastitatis]|uniref:MobA/MobL family protein n=1 Tax=Teichococcus vastitatis TaxID=2307076 RepID=UPI001EE3AD06|nr:MobA/MobL family protein [Pseudoroseomonas vastitatis]
MSAYQRCARVERRDGKPYDFRRKRAEHIGHAMLLPEGAPAWAADPAALWQAAEDAERRGDAQVARLVEFAIPRAIPINRRMDLVRAVVAPWVTEGMAAQVDLHCPMASDGAEQPHAHVLLTLRRLDGAGFAATKERAWNQAFRAEEGRAMRGRVAAATNAWLEANGVVLRVDHRTHEARGIPGPAAEANVARAAWTAHRTAPESAAAGPVREVLAWRPERTAARREIAWQEARAAYAAAAAEHYAALRVRRQTARAAQQRRHAAERDSLRSGQRHARSLTYAVTRGSRTIRTIVLGVQVHRHAGQRQALTVAQQAERMFSAAAEPMFPTFGGWIEERAAAGDATARAALAVREARRACFARKDPAAAARRRIEEVIRAADRVLRGRPTGSVDADALATEARGRLTRRRDEAVERLRAARQAVWDHRCGSGWWTRLADARWRAEHRRLAAAALAARQDADRIGRGYENDVRTARAAAEWAAKANRHALVAWVDRAETQAARRMRAAAEVVMAAIAEGDEATIAAAARTDLPTAAARAEAWRAERQQVAAEAVVTGALPRDPRAAALRALLASERQVEADPARLTAARRATAAALAGDEATIKAVRTGRMFDVETAAAEWHRRQDRMAERKHAMEDERRRGEQEPVPGPKWRPRA